MQSSLPVPARISAAPPLVTDADVEGEVRRLFDAGGGSGLVIRVYGEDGPAGQNDDAFRELLASLKMYDDRYRDGGEILVEPPSADVIARALTVLARAEHQR